MARLQIENLFVEVEGKEILKGFSLTMQQGEIHALMGPNGTGKSTLSYAIMGHPRYKVTGGDILLDGESQCVLQVVVLQITHLSGVVILQQAQRTVEAQHLAAQVERRKPARLVGAERPVRGEKRIFGDHRGDRMVLRRIDRLVERKAELYLLRFLWRNCRTLRPCRCGEYGSCDDD